MTDETKDIHKLEPAFPRSYVADGHNGMTLRDWFAAQAMAAIISKIPVSSGTRESQAEIKYMTAQGAYSYADAMLAERSK